MSNKLNRQCKYLNENKNDVDLPTKNHSKSSQLKPKSKQHTNNYPFSYNITSIITSTAITSFFLFSTTITNQQLISSVMMMIIIITITQHPLINLPISLTTYIHIHTHLTTITILYSNIILLLITETMFIIIVIIIITIYNLNNL